MDVEITKKVNKLLKKQYKKELTGKKEPVINVKLRIILGAVIT